MQIIRCNESWDAAWNAFVQTSPHASFYHRAEWRRVTEQSFGHRTAYLAAAEGSQIHGVFPIVRLKSALFGTIGCSMPFVNYGGPAADTPEIERLLLEAAGGVADEWGVDYLEIRSRHDLGERFPSSHHKVSMTIELEPDPETIWNAFDRTHRKEIRRAYKNGFIAKFGPELMNDFYTVLSESWRDLGTPIYADTYLRTVVETFPEATRVCVVYAEDGTPAAAAFVGLHNGIVEGMWLGMRGAYRRQLVGYVLYWELIKNACEGGFKRFHLGRSTAESGAEQFKKKWNAEAKQLYWQYVLRTRNQIPKLSVTNPRYHLAIKAWQKLPIPVTQMLGPFIARSIP